MEGMDVRIIYKKVSHLITGLNQNGINNVSLIHRCGEDERPLNELLVLQLNGHDGRNDVSMCKVFSNNWGQYKHKFINNSKISVGIYFSLTILPAF